MQTYPANSQLHIAHINLTPPLNPPTQTGCKVGKQWNSRSRRDATLIRVHGRPPGIVCYPFPSRPEFCGEWSFKSVRIKGKPEAYWLRLIGWRWSKTEVSIWIQWNNYFFWCFGIVNQRKVCFGPGTCRSGELARQLIRK